MYNVRPRCGQTITHHYMPSARLLYPHERVGPCPLDKLYPCSHTTINYLKNVPLVSYYYNAMWSNGQVYATCGSLPARFHIERIFLPSVTIKLLKKPVNGACRVYNVRNSWYQVGCPCRAKCGWPTFILCWVLCGSSGPAISLSN